MFSLAKGGELKSAANNWTDLIRPHSAQTSSTSDIGSNKWKVVNGWGPEYPSIIFPFWLTRYAYLLDAWMIDLDSGKMQEEPGKSVMAKTMMITQLQSPWQLLKLQICAQHQPDMVEWISLKSIIFCIVRTDIDSTATEWMHQCLQSHAKRIQGHETEPYPWSIALCIDPNSKSCSCWRIFG